MAEVIGVRFKEVSKVYYFDPDGIDISEGEMVIVETARGIECGDVVIANKSVEDDDIVHPLKKVIRLATDRDRETLINNIEKEKRALEICKEKVEEFGLDMCLVRAEYTFDGSKILFYFTSDGRVDFRELVKCLASTFKTRIELRQIGVRDEAKMVGGLGICGRAFCCKTFLGEFQPVGIKMAKEQGLSLNPTKISGTCGRLMCCLKYEQDAYEYLIRMTPKIGSTVETPEGTGTVLDVNMLTGVLSVQLNAKPEAAPHSFRRDEVKHARGAKKKPAKQEEERFSEEE